MGLLLSPCPLGGRRAHNCAFSSGIHSSKSPSLGNRPAQPRRNCVLGKAQKTWIIPFRIPHSHLNPHPHSLGWKEYEEKKKEITSIVSKTVLSASSAGSLHPHSSLSPRFQWGNGRPERHHGPRSSQLTKSGATEPRPHLPASDPFAFPPHDIPTHG